MLICRNCGAEFIPSRVRRQIARLGYGAERAAQDDDGKFNKDKGFSRRRYQLVAAAVARSMCWRASISRPARVLAATNIACNVAFAKVGGGHSAVSRAVVGAPPRMRTSIPILSSQNFLKHSPKWNVFTILHSTTLLLPSGCTWML